MMNSQFLEIFFVSFAWSFWPTLFLLVTIYVTRKFIIGINDAVKDRNVEGKIKKKEFHNTTTDDIPKIEKEFKMPKIETSFGNQRIGEIHEHGKKT